MADNSTPSAQTPRTYAGTVDVSLTARPSSPIGALLEGVLDLSRRNPRAWITLKNQHKDDIFSLFPQARPSEPRTIRYCYDLLTNETGVIFPQQLKAGDYGVYEAHKFNGIMRLYEETPLALLYDRDLMDRRGRKMAAMVFGSFKSAHDKGSDALMSWFGDATLLADDMTYGKALDHKALALEMRAAGLTDRIPVGDLTASSATLQQTVTGYWLGSMERAQIPLPSIRNFVQIYFKTREAEEKATAAPTPHAPASAANAGIKDHAL